MFRFLTAALLLALSSVSHAADSTPPPKNLPLPGEVFSMEGHTAFLIAGKVEAASNDKPWVWYAPTLPNLPGKEEKWMFEQFRDAGIAVAGIDVGESYGSPAGQTLFTALYTELTVARGYSRKPVLIGRSRGGLMTLSWAASNPGKVGGFAGIYPVCNIESYPGVDKAAGAFETAADELKVRLAEFNPVDRLAPLAKAGVPLFSIHGDVDKTVPLEANSGLLNDRYKALGGGMQLIVPAGQGHNMWTGFFQSAELVAFVKAHASRALTLSSPLDYQVVQRASREKGTLKVSGEIAESAGKVDLIETRIFSNGKPGDWKRLDAKRESAKFSAMMEAPAGGWHQLEVRARSGENVLGVAVVEHLGVGEVFVVAGQSNSANHGEEKQISKSGMVSTFDGNRWRLSADPQPGASGGGGSFIPPFGDAIAEKFHVPVGIVATGVGATSVREWLPKGATFPNPPTLTGQVRQLDGGGWESKGNIYGSFTGRMSQCGTRGFRAVLWHQGESDANQADSTRTLPGTLYREYLEKLIRDSRTAIGWEAPWFVAQVSYHIPGDEASPDIRAAQASLWKDGFANEGPDSDALKGNLREAGGKGVHFSGPGLREHAARWVEKVAPWLEGLLN